MQSVRARYQYGLGISQGLSKKSCSVYQVFLTSPEVVSIAAARLRRLYRLTNQRTDSNSKSIQPKQKKQYHLIPIKPHPALPPHSRIQHPIVNQQTQTPRRDEKQQPAIRPVASRIPNLLLPSLVDPNPHNLARRPERDVHRDRQPHRARREQVTAQPA